MKSSEVNLLTPRMIDQAEEVARDPQQRHKLQDLETTSHQWAGHVKQLIDATQQANLPWSKTAERLKTAAKSEVGFQTQVKLLQYYLVCGRPLRKKLVSKTTI